MNTPTTSSAPRLDVTKTCKLFIAGAFPRSESGRSLPVLGAKGEVLAHVAHASRKDLRDSVEAARGALPKWSGSTALLRGQVLYRLAEMLEARRTELREALALSGTHAAGGATARKPAAKSSKSARSSTPRARAGALSPQAEVALAIDRVVHYAGWCDKHAQVLGCNNPVAGPFYNFTAPEPTGVVGVVCPNDAPLLGMVSLLCPVLTPGNTAVVIAPQSAPLVAVALSEAIATSDVPGGVVNVLTGLRDELLPHLASHRDVDAIAAWALPAAHATLLREGTAENLKRVRIFEGSHTHADAQGPAWIEPFVEFKTMWHPALA